jgi:hypothetical protein
MRIWIQDLTRIRTESLGWIRIRKKKNADPKHCLRTHLPKCINEHMKLHNEMHHCNFFPNVKCTTVTFSPMRNEALQIASQPQNEALSVADNTIEQTNSSWIHFNQRAYCFLIRVIAKLANKHAGPFYLQNSKAGGGRTKDCCLHLYTAQKISHGKIRDLTCTIYFFRINTWRTRAKV